MVARCVKPIAVFLGPSLPLAEARALCDADYFPPARHRDIYRVLTSGVRVIVLIDGIFHDTPSVWQREVLAAIDDGVTVIGAASMGALRAAELHAFGMIGCGTIFEWYRDGVIDADDEVALLHAGPEVEFQAGSEPLVNIRATLASAAAAGLIAPEQERELLGDVRALHYTDRTYDALWRTPLFDGLTVDRQQSLRAYVETRPTNLKAADARLALVRAQAALDAPSVVLPESHDRSLWHWLAALHAGMWSDVGVVSVVDMLKTARAQPQLWGPRLVPMAADANRAMAIELGTRFFATAWARRVGLWPAAEELVPLSRAFEERWGVTPTRELLAANGLTARAYAEALCARARYDWLVARAGVQDGRELVARWAAERRILLDGFEGEGLVDTVLARGPTYFGYDWSGDVALVRELQLTGLAAVIADAVPR